jgi:hypothetical protein
MWYSSTYFFYFLGLLICFFFQLFNIIKHTLYYIKNVGFAQLFDIKKHMFFYIKYVGFAQLFDAQFGHQICWLCSTFYIKYVGFFQLII